MANIISRSISFVYNSIQRHFIFFVFQRDRNSPVSVAVPRRAWLVQMINLYYSKAVSCSSEEMSGERMEECGEKWEARRRRSIICSILLLCCAGALQGILVNGLINVVISTIEKRLIS